MDKQGASWYVDGTYLKVHGKWCYLYRAIDKDGNLVNSLLSEKRNREAAKQFFKQAVDVVGHVPDQVTTDGHTSSPRAIRETMGSNVSIGRTNTSIIAWSKITVASNSVTIPCVALGTVNQQHASVVLLTNYATISVLAAPWAKRSLSWNNDRLFSNVLLLSRHRYKPPHRSTSERRAFHASGKLFCDLSSDRTNQGESISENLAFCAFFRYSGNSQAQRTRRYSNGRPGGCVAKTRRG